MITKQTNFKLEKRDLLVKFNKIKINDFKVFSFPSIYNNKH